MERINEFNNGASTFNRGDFTRGIPFYGSKGDFNFTLSRSKFTPGISISQKALTDMSVKGDPGFSDFDTDISKLKFFFKPGDRIRGLIVNSQLDHENGKIAIGKLQKIVPNYSNNTLRAWIKDPKTLEIKEIYPQTMERIYESSYRALTFSQFINS